MLINTQVADKHWSYLQLYSLSTQDGMVYTEGKCPVKTSAPTVSPTTVPSTAVPALLPTNSSVGILVIAY